MDGMPKQRNSHIFHAILSSACKASVDVTVLFLWSASVARKILFIKPDRPDCYAGPRQETQLELEPTAIEVKIDDSLAMGVFSEFDGFPVLKLSWFGGASKTSAYETLIYISMYFLYIYA